MSYIIEGSREEQQRALGGGAVYNGFIGAVHVEGPKRAVDGSRLEMQRA